MKIVFFGSTNLGLPILESLRGQNEIVAVVTTPDAAAGRRQEPQETPVSALARDLHIETFKPESLKNNQEFLLQLKNLSADMFVVVAYGKILPPELINIPQYKTLNVHPSLLPKYRGPSPIRTALLNGDNFTGISFIILDEQVDHGPVLSQQTETINEDDNDFTLTDKLGRKSAQAINQVIADYVSGKITPKPQDDLQASYTKMIFKVDGKVDWQKTAAEIYNQFRAFYPWPGLWTVWNGKNLKILDAIPFLGENQQSSDLAGTALPGGLVVCGNGTMLKIKTLQIEGKGETDMQSFLNGYPQFAGSRLGQ